MQVLTKKVLLISVVSIASFAVTTAAVSYYKAPQTPPSLNPKSINHTQPQADPEATTGIPLTKGLDGDLTILACGTDGSDNLTDVVALIRLDAESGKVYALQIPRDTFIGKDYPTGKINSIYKSKNHDQTIKELKSLIETQLQVPIDRYVLVSLDTVKRVVDEIGGVRMDIPEQINYLPGKVLYPGEQLLDGDKSIWVIRHRQGYVNGDIGRLDMQKQFVLSALSSAKQLGKLKAVTTAAKLLPMVKTDLSLSEGAAIASTLMDFSTEDIETAVLPGYGEYFYSYAVYVPNKKEITPIINAFFREDSPITDDQLATVIPPKVVQPKVVPKQETPPSEIDTPSAEGFDFSWDFG